MAPVRRFCVLAFCFGLACGDSSAPTPPALVVADGDGQFAFVGGALPDPLVVQVTGSGGGPTSGATVQWTVTAGVATLAAASSVTDGSGFAAMTVTVGDQPEPIAVRADATGLPSVTFTASACALPVAFTFPDTVSDSLATTDCRAGGYYTDFFSLDLTSGQQGVTISMTSTVLDAWIDVYHGDRRLLGFHDDIVQGVDQNSLFEAIVAPGTYILALRSFDQDTTGAYDVSVVARPQTLANCDMVWVTRGVTVTDSLSSADCVDLSGPYYADFLIILLDAGSVLTVTERSTAFDAYVSLYEWDGANGVFFAAENNDSAASTNDAHLVYTAPRRAPYLLFPSTFPAGATGAYTLTIDASSAAPAPVLLTPLRLPKAWPLPMRGHRR